MTEKKFYKLDEFEGHLPNPKVFPAQGQIILEFNDFPHIFSDGFMLDMGVDDGERERLKDKVERTSTKDALDQLIITVSGCDILLSEPQYIYNYIYTSYVLVASNIKPVAIQVKYYRYFRNRYPNCMFYATDKSLTMLAIKSDGKLIGLVMPVVIALGDIELEEEIKEALSG